MYIFYMHNAESSDVLSADVMQPVLQQLFTSLHGRTSLHGQL